VVSIVVFKIACDLNPCSCYIDWDLELPDQTVSNRENSNWKLTIHLKPVWVSELSIFIGPSAYFHLHLASFTGFLFLSLESKLPN
jgi:hypothetical protein